MNIAKTLLHASGTLQIKHGLLSQDTPCKKLSGYKFSLRKYLQSVRNKEYSLENGKYEVYTDYLLPWGTNLHVLELAVTNIYREYLVAYDFGPAVKIRMPLFQSLQLTKIPEHP